MKTPLVSRRLAPLSLVLATSLSSSLAAQDEGFGGGAADEDAAEAAPDDDSAGERDARANDERYEESSCLLQDDDGNWLPCDHVLAARAKAAGKVPANGATGEDLDERPPLALPPPPEDDGPKLREISETRPAKGAFGRLVAGNSEQLAEEFPLLKLRVRVDALKAEAEELTQHPTRHREAPAKYAEHETWKAVLERVEGVAFHLMRSCIASEMPDWSETYTAPSLYRMTPGGPVLASREERRKLPSFDPPGCERLRLVDDATIEKVRRLHEIEDTLRNGRLGYYERDQRKALEREATALKHELGEGGPAPLPKLFDSKERRDTKPQPLPSNRRPTGAPLR